jgi:hypothetical protein
MVFPIIGAGGASVAAANAGKAGVSLGTVASIAGTGLAAINAIRQGNAAKAQANYQAAVARQQAEVARRQAERERLIGEQEAQLFRRRQSANIASLRARRGGSGVDATGTPLLTEDVLFGDLLLGAETIRRQGIAKANDFLMRADEQEASARLAKIKGRAARTSGFLDAGSSLLSGFGKLKFD